MKVICLFFLVFFFLFVFHLWDYSMKNWIEDAKMLIISKDILIASTAKKRFCIKEKGCLDSGLWHSRFVGRVVKHNYSFYSFCYCPIWEILIRVNRKRRTSFTLIPGAPFCTFCSILVFVSRIMSSAALPKKVQAE